jgi:hypothetical protein
LWLIGVSVRKDRGDIFFILKSLPILDYSQVLDDAPRLQAFLEKYRFKTENPKHFAAQEQRRILGKFVNYAGEMSRQGQDICSIRNSRKPSPSPVRDEIYAANTS